MILLAFFQWWYGRGWAEQGRAIFTRTDKISKTFSVGILFKTWFAPWKQVVSYTSHTTSLENRFRASVDNLVSRVVGGFVRTMVMFAAILVMLIAAIAGVIVVLIWPTIPLLPVLLAAVALGLPLW